MKVTTGRPPNYNEIVAVLPQARRMDVFFAYGDTIYTPGGREPSHHLLVHEATHAIRQKEIGIDFWWHKYLTDMRFRYYEELLAHRAEYRSMLGSAMNRNRRRVALKAIASRLASPLYGVGGGWKKAAKDILDGVPDLDVKGSKGSAT